MPAEFDLIVRGGVVVSSAGRNDADVGIQGGKIVAVGDLRESTAVREISAQGLHVLPGVIDTQVHFREPGLTHKEDIETGSRAAVMGGVTTYFEMPNTNPATTTREALEGKLARAKGRSWANYAFFIGASAQNVDELAALEMLPGTPGVKLFIGSSTGDLLVEEDELIARILEAGVRPCAVHAEDEARLRERKSLLSDNPHVREHPFIRDEEVALLATKRMIALCKRTGRPVHILHISTWQEFAILVKAKGNRLPVTCEVTPQHLSLNAEAYEALGTLVQMNPPIRDEEHRRELWSGVSVGLFDVFGSDHAPHTLEEKQQPYPKSPSGMPGVQTMLPILLDWVHRSKLELEKVVKMTAERPAELFGIAGKGHIAPGYDADLAVVDLEEEFEVTKYWIQSKCRWSPFEGQFLIGKPVHTIVNGVAVVSNGVIVGEPAGRMVEFTWKN
ncbi:MAG: dihydroorotase [Armatimonadetes bacterium]|nr:dihydroorotase [Armatimonadota bacterium]